MMDELYFSVNLDEGRTLYLAPITDRRLEMAGMDISDTSGHFLFEQRGTGATATVEVLAQIVSPEGLLRLREMLGMS